MPELSAIVLAAGGATRMGRDKALLELGGELLVRRSVNAAAAAGAGEILVVVNPHNHEAITEALRALPVHLVCNEHHAHGIGSSIARGAAAVATNAPGALLLQADQPLIDPTMLVALIDTWRNERPAFVASSYAGVTTTPVLFDRRLFAELRTLDGDTGARRVLQHHAANGRVVEFPPWRGQDIDTEEDYIRAREVWEERSRLEPRTSDS